LAAVTSAAVRFSGQPPRGSMQKLARDPASPGSMIDTAFRTCR
jgi:hypothetical protein